MHACRDGRRAQVTSPLAWVVAAVVTLAVVVGGSTLGYRRWQQEERSAKERAQREAREKEARDRRAAQDREVEDLIERISREKDEAERARLRAKLAAIRLAIDPDAGRPVRFVDRCMEGDPLCPFPE